METIIRSDKGNDVIELLAPAKLNLVLEVLGKRPDGYHEISSIMQSVSLYDRLIFLPSRELHLFSNYNGISVENNLIIRAAEMLKTRYGVGRGATIELEKHIPVSAGLGGGSSDAAAALVGLNRLWSLNLSFDELMQIGSEMGSDIPFFLKKGTCLAQGRGNIITALPDIDETWFILINPQVAKPDAKTAFMYGLIDKSHFTDGGYTDKLCKLLVEKCRLDGCSLFNVFDGVAFLAYQGLERFHRLFKKYADVDVHLAGSGPGMFALIGEKERALWIAEKLTQQRLEVHLAKSITGNEIRY
jgi:4-diphosphocytidyl-2-C-methyl-D-erythritol kinase